jgi:hypothetical protein
MITPPCRTVIRTVLVSLLALPAVACESNPAGVDDGEPATQFKASGGRATSPTPTFTFANSAVGVAGDGKFLVAGGGSSYANGVCGVQTVVYTGTGASGDATLETDYSVNRKCADYPRRLRFNWPDAAPEASSARVNLGAMGGTGGIYAVPVGETRTMPLNINNISSTRCTMLKFRDYYLGDPSQPSVGGRDVLVHRENSKTWHVSTPVVAADESTAECKRPDGSFEPINLSVSFTVVE